MALSICVAQLNPTVGDWQGNLAQALAAAAHAHAQGHSLLVFPELFLTGYAAGDLYARPRFLHDAAQALQQLQEASTQWPSLHILISHVEALDPQTPLPPDTSILPPASQVVSLLREGQRLGAWRKQTLPNEGAFDEKRYFLSGIHHHGQPDPVIEIAGMRLGILVCADAWKAEPAARAKAAGAQALLALNASPFTHDKPAARLRMARARTQETGLPLLYANLLGGQDELVFDGHSFAMQANGQTAGHAPAFEECLWPLRLAAGPDGLQWLSENDASGPISESSANSPDALRHHATWHALTLATRDYVRKNGFSHVLLGLSGGLDSALVLTIAVDALGADRVHAIMMPSPYTASISVDDAREMVQRLGVRYDEISIRETFEGFKHSLAPLFAGRAEDATEENLQARIRGVMLMAISNKFGGLLLTTSNKSEVAMGYSTLYGDSCGGFAPLKDIFKSEAFALARWRNAHTFGLGPATPIPERIITRPPSAELRENQTDQDSLPPYEMLDAIVRLRMQEEHSAEQIIAAGYPAERVAQVFKLLRISEYKRQQSAPGPKLSARSFGRDWRYPITNRYRD